MTEKREVINCPSCDVVAKGEVCELMTVKKQEKDRLIVCCCESLAKRYKQVEH